MCSSASSFSSTKGPEVTDAFFKKKLSIFKLKSDHETYFFVKPPSLRRRSVMQRKCAASILPQCGSTTPIYVLVNSDNVSSK